MKRPPKEPENETGLQCDDCHKRKASTRDTVCPFDQDVHDKQTPVRLCDECYYERARAI